MRLQLVSFELAKLLKDVGFDADTLWSYDLDRNQMFKLNSPTDWNKPNRFFNNISMPTLELAKMWFRERHKIHIMVQSTFGASDTYICFVNQDLMMDETAPKLKDFEFHRLFKSHEAALEAGLIKACELIKTK